MTAHFDLDWETYSDMSPAQQAQVRETAMRHAHALREEALHQAFRALFRPLRWVGESLWRRFRRRATRARALSA